MICWTECKAYFKDKTYKPSFHQLTHLNSYQLKSSQKMIVTNPHHLMPKLDHKQHQLQIHRIRNPFQLRRPRKRSQRLTSMWVRKMYQHIRKNLKRRNNKSLKKRRHRKQNKKNRDWKNKRNKKKRRNSKRNRNFKQLKKQLSFSKKHKKTCL